MDRGSAFSRPFPTVPVHIPAEPSEGVFYLVRLPDGWQLCSFRHDEYGPIGLPDCWVQVLEPFLNIWLAHLEQEGRADYKKRHSALESALGMLVAGYDAFPRGEVRRGADRKHYVIRHGGEFTRAMHVPHREVEEAFGVRGHAKWVEDMAHVSDHKNAQRVRALLSIKERWEDV
jgi:hypothetical protein